MDQNLCTADGLLTEANIDHYEQRAAGGIGLAILETSAVAYPVGATSRHQPSLSSDACIDGLHQLATRLHAKGTRVIVQACHHGKTALVDTLEDRDQLVPSAPLPAMDYGSFAIDLTMDELMRMGNRMQGKTASHRQATVDDLAWVVDQFADAAERIATAGCDGIEIHAAHGYLISTFLSPHWNRRDDGYGGTVEGRTRLLREIVAAIRSRCGAGFVVVVRLDGCEFRVDGGITPQLAAQHAQAAVDAGADAIHVSAMGAPDSGVAFTDGPLPWQPGQYREITSVVRAAVDVPVIAVGRLDAALGDEMIAAGEADFIAMGRGLLADPQLVSRLNEGRPDLIRPCINCFVCVAENFWDASPRCAVNARLGRDAPVLSATSEPHHLVIIGGGPAGLEAARVGAARGHTVTLFERDRQLGGTARFSAVTTPLNGDLVDYLIAAVADLGVTVHTATTPSAADVAALKPDRVLVATGAVRSRPELRGADLDHVLTGDDLRLMLTGESSPDGVQHWGGISTWQKLIVRAGQALRLTTPARVRTLSRRYMPLGSSIVVIGGGLVGVEIAEFLAERDRSVTVLEPSAFLASEMAHPRRWRTMHRARSHGVEFVTNAVPVEITASEVTFEVGGEQQTVAADQVVIADGVFARAPIADQLRAIGLHVDVIGDAHDVGYIEGAIRSGFDAAATDALQQSPTNHHSS